MKKLLIIPLALALWYWELVLIFIGDTVTKIPDVILGFGITLVVIAILVFGVLKFIDFLRLRAHNRINRGGAGSGSTHV